jgi:hypothetical protein
VDSRSGRLFRLGARSCYKGEPMSEGRIVTDLDRWPIVVHRTIGSPPDPEVDAFISRANDIVARRERHVVIFDSLLSGVPSAYMRKRSIDWLRSNADALAKDCAGTGLVFRSPALRFVMSGVMLVQSHSTPHKVCASLEEALIWAREQLRIARAAR